MGSFPSLNIDLTDTDDARDQLILIVDDEPRIRSAYRQLLDGSSRRIEEAGSGAEAIRRLERNDVDVVILDLTLPDISGIEILDWMDRHHVNTTVIVFSADERIDMAIQSLRRGAFEFIRKSCEPEELMQTVSNALHRRRLEQAHALMTAHLEQSERLHRFLVEQSPDIIYTLDDAGCFVFLNGRIEALLGYKREELVGKHYSTIVHHDDVERARYAFQERRGGDRATTNVEIRLQCKEDGYRHFDNQLVVAMLSSLGIYDGERATPVNRFVGTYGVARDITERKRAEETISFQAFHDLLTRLPNRSLFKDRLEHALAHAHRNNTTVGLMFMDLDRFKQVNDTYGHAAGDELLKGFAQRVRQCLRADDTLARQGGDEFTALLPDLATSEDAAGVAAKILASLERPMDLLGREFRATASVGIAVYPHDGHDPDTLLQAADIAMYQVKLHGKNGFQRYHPDMSRVHHQRMTFENDLHLALERGQFELFYQPQISISQKRVVGVEALIRWRHPEQGLIGPSQFIAIAEENGLIHAISDWVLETGCRQMARWREAGLHGIRLSVNVSPQEFFRDDLVSRLTQAAERHGIAFPELEIEITENLLMEDAENVITKVRKLRNRGIRVAIDDFGTRYSSLNYLRRFSVSTLKIDQSFVRDLDASGGSRSIIHAITGIAEGFGLDLIAEGVEDAERRDMLIELGCDQMQGYYFARPAPAAELEAQLRHGI
jgi:diguanylate cyclase (GGDEF)-like protein/PAS domain S-box-containing protein